MKRKWYLLFIVLLVVTAMLAAVHRTKQQPLPCLQIETNNHQWHVSAGDLNRTSFSGTLVNGKGEKKEHTFRGILLRELLDETGVDLEVGSIITITSADQYSAVFSAEELLQEDRVYLAVEQDGQQLDNIDRTDTGVQAVVFGDPNSRRCVRFAVLITIESGESHGSDQ